MHICPWWLGYFLLIPFRKWVQDPARILEPFVSEGMTVVEPGPGMGYFTLELARRVGEKGRVVAVDVQSKMLETLKSRAVKAGLSGRLETRLAPATGEMGLRDLNHQADFALAFAVVHELPDQKKFWAEMSGVLKPGGRLLFAEPSGHVNAAAFEESLGLAKAAGFRESGRPRIWRSRAAVLTK